MPDLLALLPPLLAPLIGHWYIAIKKLLPQDNSAVGTEYKLLRPDLIMTFNEAKTYLLSKPGAVESYPFYVDLMVPKVGGKMFATLSFRNGSAQMNLKCDPDEALALRDIFRAVIPGYHMNKKHWNTVILDGSIPQNEIKRMIDNSYQLVIKNLSSKIRTNLSLPYD